MKNSEPYHKPEEVDIIYLFTGFKNMFKSIGLGIYRLLHFFLKNILWIIVSLALGVITAIIIDLVVPKTYKSEVYVVTNLDSSNYLYNYIDNFDSKNFKNLKSPITHVEIEPVKDVFSLVKSENLELFKVLLDKGQNTEFFKEDLIEKNYRYHKITFKTSNDNDIESSMDSLLIKINNSEYLQNRLVKEKENIKLQLKESLITIDNINDLFTSFEVEGQAQLNVQTFSNLSDVLYMKNRQLDLVKKLNNKLIEYKKPVYVIHGSYGVESSLFFGGKLYLILPVLMLLLFLILKGAIYIYKKYSHLDVAQ